METHREWFTVYHVIDDADTLRKIIVATVEWMEAQMQKGSLGATYFSSVVEKYLKTSQDFILRGAPCLIVAMADKTFLYRSRDNTHFSLAYVELYAPSIGLGTCYAGFFESCATSRYKPLLQLLNLTEGMVVTGGLMVD